MAQEIYHRSEWGNPTEQWGNVYLNADLTNELYKRASEYENSWVTDQLLNGVGTKPSIILTPTAYEDGVLNSVKPAKTFGSELVTNGTFDTDTDWSKGTGWSIANGNASYDGSGTGYQYILQSITTTSGSIYKINFDVLSSTGTNLNIVDFGAVRLNLTHLNQGNYTFYAEADSTSENLAIYANGTDTFSIDNVSVKKITEADFDFTRGSSATRVNEQGLVQDVQLLSGELVQNGDFEQISSELVTNGSFDTDSDWTKGTGWSIANGKASYDGLNGTQQIFSNTGYTPVVGKTYKITFNVLSQGDGNNTASFGGVVFSNTNLSVNAYEFYVTAVSTGRFGIFGRNGGVFSIDNISVKEVGQNWEFGTGWSIEDGKVYFDNPTGTEFYQSLSTTAGKYRISFDLDITSGTIQTSFSSPSVSTVQSFTTSGSKTVDITTTASFSRFRFVGLGGSVFNIDNISVIEVTDDTDLPRINYTNFSYEDVLGDELASPLDFTSDWTSTGATSITENSFQTSGSGIGIYFSLEADKKYKIKVSNVSGDISIRYRTSNGGAGTVAGNFDEFIIINTFGSTTPNIYLRANSETTVTVGDITIKELTEDVVVPYSGEGSLLLEPQSTNLMPYSEDFTQWTNSTTNLDVPSNVTQTNPSGGSESGFININNGVSASKFIYEPISTTSSIHTQSVFFKYHSRQWIQLVSGGTSHYANFDIQNGVVGNVSGCTATIKDYGNGWYKCTATLTSAATPINIAITVIDDDATTRIPVCTGTGSYYVWGAQVEALSYATSYIPTEGSIKTRLADVCKNSGNSDLINSTEGVLYAEISAFENDTSSRDIYLSDGTANNRIRLRFDNSNNLNVLLYNGSVQVATTQVITDATSFNKIAFKYKVNDFALWVNGTEIFTDTSGTVCSGLNDLSFFATYVSTNNFYGNVKCVAVFKEALSDTELQKLTTI